MDLVQPISPKQYQRFKRLRTSDRWTQVVHEVYPAARQNPRMVVVFDPHYSGGRWGFGMDVEGYMRSGQSLILVRYVKLIYYWQGPGDTYLEPSSRMGVWLRDHDTCSERYVGEWEDRMFGADDKRHAAAEKSWDAELKYGAKQIYDQFGRRAGLPPPEQKAPRKLDGKWHGGIGTVRSAA